MWSHTELVVFVAYVQVCKLPNKLVIYKSICKIKVGQLGYTLTKRYVTIEHFRIHKSHKAL